MFKYGGSHTARIAEKRLKYPVASTTTYNSHAGRRRSSITSCRTSNASHLRAKSSCCCNQCSAEWLLQQQSPATTVNDEGSFNRCKSPLPSSSISLYNFMNRRQPMASRFSLKNNTKRVNSSSNANSNNTPPIRESVSMGLIFGTTIVPTISNSLTLNDKNSHVFVNGNNGDCSSNPITPICDDALLIPTMASQIHRNNSEPLDMSPSTSGISEPIQDSSSNAFPELDTKSLDALLKKLFPTKDYKPNRSIIFSLLLNLRVFISPEEILQKLLQHCMFEQNANMARNFGKASRQQLFENVYELMEEWTNQIPYDFRLPSMRNRLLELFGLCRGDTTKTQQLRCDDLVLNLRATLSKWERYENALKNLQQNVEDPPIQSDQQIGLINICPSAILIAQQLTHIELERLSMIGADEFVEMLRNSTLETLGQFPENKNYCLNERCQRCNNLPQNGKNNNDSLFKNKKSNEEHSDECGAKEFMPLANIRHYIAWFNQLTALVASEILRHSRKRHRVRCIEFLIECARECCNVGNFNSLMAIVAGLSAYPIARLKRTWSRVEKSKLKVLQHQLDPSGNFLSYRATLKAAIWRAEGAKNDAEKIIIPFFGLLLKDLFMVHRHCRQTIPNENINFSMFNEFANQISNISKWKNRACPFKKYNPVLQYLLLGATYSEKNMLLLSYQYEVPETNADREQFKKLSDDFKEFSTCTNNHKIPHHK